MTGRSPQRVASTGGPPAALRVALHVAIGGGGHVGGTEQFLGGLIRALGHLEGPDRYLLVTSWRDPHWCRPYMGANQSSVVTPVPTAKAALKTIGRKITSRLGSPRDPRRADQARRQQLRRFHEGLPVDVVHFPVQEFFDCGKPTIFNPHDLLHEHHPEFLDPAELSHRQALYERGCRGADLVAAESPSAREDIIRCYGLGPDQVIAIERGAPLTLGPGSGERSGSLPCGVSDGFALYPAQTWPHKNHERLLRAVARARDDHGTPIELVCTGRRNPHWPQLERLIEQLDLSALVHFPGYVSDADLAALYDSARFLVFPSLFEGGGFPIQEAMALGLPVACSRIGPLVDYGGDSVLMFDPASVSEMAGCLVRMASDDGLLASLVARGERRAERFDWANTALKYRALYRKLATGALSVEDAALFGSDPFEGGVGP